MPKRIMISLPVPVIENLDEVAEKLDLTRSGLIRDIINDKLKG